MAAVEYVPALSAAEKERRWGLVRDKLRAEGLDGLLVYGHTLQQMGSNFQYLTQIWGKDGGSMLIFPAEGEPRMVLPAYGGAARMASSWVNPDLVRPTINFAADVAAEVRDMGLDKGRLGVDNFVTWPARDYMVFTELCPDAELVDMYVPMGRIRARKSAEELALMRSAIDLAEKAHRVFMDSLVPGTDCAEAVARAEGVLIANGVSRDRIILTHSDPEMVYPYTPRNEPVDKSRPVTLSTEYTMICGGGCQAIRTYAWEEPRGDMKRLFELCGEMRVLVPKVFRPGLEITASGAELIRLVESYGFSCDKLGHACGVTYGEQPFITGGPGQLDYCEWTIQADEVYVVHPMIRSADGTPPFVWFGDMFFIGSDKTECMTRFLPGQPVILG